MSNAEPFKIGDTVMLRSGGPLMTVTNIIDWLVMVTWFEGNNVFNNSFHKDALRVIEIPAKQELH